MSAGQHQATFHFHGDLRFFLPPPRQQPVEHRFGWRASVKDMIESLGVPHTEIDLIVADGLSVSFNYIVRPQAVIHVYPPGEGAETDNRVALRPPYPARPAFVLDQHLGRLAAYLRMMGFDTLYRNDYDDEELALISQRENRILLTRDVGLLKRSIVTYGYYVRATHREKQLAELTQRFGLADAVQPFKHCMKCNGLLHPVSKEAIAAHLPDGTAQYYDTFHQCAACSRVYWKGPHYQRMQGLMDRVLNGH